MSKGREFADQLVQELSEEYVRQLAEEALEKHGIGLDDHVNIDVGPILQTVLKLIDRDWEEMLTN